LGGYDLGPQEVELSVTADDLNDSYVDSGEDFVVRLDDLQKLTRKLVQTLMNNIGDLIISEDFETSERITWVYNPELKYNSLGGSPEPGSFDSIMDKLILANTTLSNQDQVSKYKDKISLSTNIQQIIPANTPTTLSDIVNKLSIYSISTEPMDIMITLTGAGHSMTYIKSNVTEYIWNIYETLDYDPTGNVAITHNNIESISVTATKQIIIYKGVM